jgi:hypothetical protein
MFFNRNFSIELQGKSYFGYLFTHPLLMLVLRPSFCYMSSTLLLVLGDTSSLNFLDLNFRQGKVESHRQLQRQKNRNSWKKASHTYRPGTVAMYLLD